MAFSNPIKLLAVTIVFLIFSTNLCSQKLEPKERQPEADHTITSDILDRDYQLFISLPYNYSVKDTIAYPVLYVLDGKRDFPLFNQQNKYLFFRRGMERVIIVGIAAGKHRSYDYSPTPNIDTAAVREKEIKRGIPEGSIKSGGADKFLEVIKTEISPFVDKNYKTNTDRGISGHSLGGLFAIHCLLNSDGYFTRFGINSPSLWWNKGAYLEHGVLQFAENTTWDIPPTKVFLSAGKNETTRILPGTIEFISNLQDAKYENIDLSWHVFDNENHGSVIPVSLRQTIIELYGK
jgi:hypothetical protein